jgi:hypothetical protein
MRHTSIFKLAVCAGIALLLLQACKDDSILTTPLPGADKSFTESFDNYKEAYEKGWRSINKSRPTGRIWYDVAETPDFGTVNYVVNYYPGWEQAQFTLARNQFPNATYPNRIWKDAYFSQRATNGYAATSVACAQVINFNGPTPNFTVNTWLVSPELPIKNGDRISFYTYCKSLSRLQLWVNPTNSYNAGDGGDDNTGDFNINLLDINPQYATEATDTAYAYPTDWTRFEAVVKGLSKPVTGRFGFRYLLENQPRLRTGSTNLNRFDTVYTQIHRSVIGIDEVSFKSIK